VNSRFSRSPAAWLVRSLPRSVRSEPPACSLPGCSLLEPSVPDNEHSRHRVYQPCRAYPATRRRRPWLDRGQLPRKSMRSPASRTFRRDLQGKTPRSKLFGSKSSPRFKRRQPGRNPIFAALAQWDLSTLIPCYAQRRTDFGRGASDNVVNGDAVKIFCRRRRGARQALPQRPGSLH
jgi:hypothetical protein